MSSRGVARFGFITIAVGVAVVGACSDAKHAAARGRSKGQPSVGVTDTGRVLQQGRSLYAVIANDSCPGRRIVNERFELVGELVVRITEDNTSRDCSEGIISRMTATVWRGGPGGQVVDSIHTDADRGAIADVRGSASRWMPLLEGVTSGCCGSPDTYEYWNLGTGKRVFSGETPILHFIANGAVRLLSVTGGSGDKLAVVQYGTGSGESQRVVFTHSASSKVK